MSTVILRRGALALSDLFEGLAAGEKPVPPNAFRIFRAGKNSSTKGEFLFDEAAAGKVMDAFTKHGVDLCIDRNHAVLNAGKDGEEAPAAGWFVPEVRDGELWALVKSWTARAYAQLEALEFRYFSPLFNFDEATGQITNLINLALTNVPSLDDIEPLVAASLLRHPSAIATATGESTMNEEEQKRLRARNAELELQVTTQAAELATSKPAATTIVALSTLTGLAATASPAEVQAKVTALSSFVRDVFGLVGKDKMTEALGQIGAMKGSHDELVVLKGQIATEKAAKLSADFTTALDNASEDGKIDPANVADKGMGHRGYWDKRAKDKGTEDALESLSAYLAAKPVAAGAARQPGHNGPAMGEAEAIVAKGLGIKTEDWMKAEGQRIAAGGR